MLKSLYLENFQRHRKLLLKLSPTITTIVGPTDAGKSAVLRALRWIAQNHIAGDEFIRNGEDSARVTLITEERVVERTKGGRENSYTLDGREFKAFGMGGVPDPVAKVMQVSDLNFQDQHDPPFWFKDTPGEVSRQLNAVIDLSIIDEALSHIATQVRTARERLQLTKERREAAQQELDSMKGQRQRIQEFEALQKLYLRQEKLLKRQKELSNVLMCVSALELKKKQAHLEDVEALFAKARKIRQLEQVQGDLADLLNAISDKRRKQMPPDFHDVEVAYNRMIKLSFRAAALGALVKQIQKAGEAVQEAYEHVDEANKEFTKQTKGQRCPICDNIIK